MHLFITNFSKEQQACFSVNFSGRRVPSQSVSTLKGKNLLLEEYIFSFPSLSSLRIKPMFYIIIFYVTLCNICTMQDKTMEKRITFMFYFVSYGH